MKLGVVGGGVVGRATARAFIEHVDEVRVWDIVKERCSTPSILHTLESDLIFVCLPTPQKKDSLECDTSIVEGFFAVLAECNLHRNYVLRSTVPIGTTKRLSKTYNLPNLVHSPEFLTARCSVTDAHLPSRNIVGYNYLPEPDGRACGCQAVLGNLYLSRFPAVPIHYMTSDESEAVKLFQNGFFATKIAYWNEVNALATKLGLDWDRVMEGILSDGRIAHSHTQVPGPDGKYGFGGSCLPKDVANLLHQLKENQIDQGFGIVGAVQFKNEDHRKRTE